MEKAKMQNILDMEITLHHFGREICTRRALTGTSAVLLQLDVPLHVEILLLVKLFLPRAEKPFHEVLISRVPRCYQEITVADEEAAGGGKERYRLHYVPRELPERKPKEHADLRDEEP
ncbi:hypothetical protein ACMD2_16103 [Ananas comosus]|uniref:Uncharacterized protein n=1 Tax=Ananas comosus TaxID=4615 RepID=A0A199W2H5_ANACO|nr:hypothetical protein ACMD2_16103 [Ananas comosus]